MQSVKNSVIFFAALSSPMPASIVYKSSQIISSLKHMNAILIQLC